MKEPDFYFSVNFHFPIKTDYLSIGMVLSQKNASAGDIFLLTGVSGGVLSTSDPPWRGSFTRKAFSKNCRVGNKYCKLEKDFSSVI